jgi:hypothetical protein
MRKDVIAGLLVLLMLAATGGFTVLSSTRLPTTD